VSQLHAEREPSSTGSPTRLNVAWPTAVSHCCAFAFVTFGIAPMSA
jgi:hypothetical protein